MPYANLGNYKFYYHESGVEHKQNGTILLVHAFTVDHRMWRYEIEQFKQDYHVIAVDLKGHGKSDAPESGYSRKDRVEDVKRFLDALQLKSVHYVGLSYGGTTGIGLALTYPEYLKTLTLAATSAAGYSIGPKIGKIDKIAKEVSVEAAKKKWIDSSTLWYKEDKQELRDFIRMMMSEHSGAIWADPQRGNYPREFDLERVHTIQIPTSIIIGELDRIFLPLAKTLHEKIENSELHIFPQIGHMVNLEAPEMFTEKVRQFIGKHQ